MTDSVNVTVAAVMTAPRYEAVYARNQIERALHEAKVPLTVSGGVYYGQCMQSMLEGLIETDCDYALTVDFDSVFTAAHVQRLVSVIHQEDGIDALAAIQPSRGGRGLLGSTGANEELHWDGYPLKVRSAHFGLTVIDLSKLAVVAKPWFHHTPDEDGSWGDGRTDDDVWFWRQWEKAGNSIFIDAGCRLGHMEEMVGVFDEGMTVKYVTTKEWEELQHESVVGCQSSC